MPRTHQFTENSTEEPVQVVIAQIATFRRDHHSECTTIELVGGRQIGVSETVDEVREVVEMPTGPKGEKRAADVIGNAVHVMKIATGEIEEELPDPGKENARKGGLRGGKAWPISYRRSGAQK